MCQIGKSIRCGAFSEKNSRIQSIFSDGQRLKGPVIQVAVTSLTQQQSFLGVSGGLAMLPSDLMCKELQLGLGDRSRVLAVVLMPLGD